MISKDESTTTKYYGASQYNKERNNHSQFNDGAGLFWPADAFSHTNKKTVGRTQPETDNTYFKHKREPEFCFLALFLCYTLNF